ncbi:MAG TPA: hypothetical protein VK996_05325 [Ramlibacter sp.]|nr:hypothetical protein [Ramlibacter sp.]
MLEYRTFCYMQNQKTGCTFVESFLREFSAEPLVHYEKHAIAKKRDAAKFYFINVREPLALYRSLFAYGLDGKGTVFLRLQRLGHEALYADGPAGFSQWLRFVLDSGNAAALGNGYGPQVAEIAGLMSWRFLRLSTFGFEGAAAKLGSRKELNQYFKAHYFMNAVIKQEKLRDDLSTMVEKKLGPNLKDVPAALAWINATPKINVSESLTGSDEVPVDPQVQARLFSKERLLYRHFYPDAAGFAEWRATKDS